MSNPIANATDPRVEGFVAGAAHLGALTHAAIAELKLQTNLARGDTAVAKERLQKLERQGSGFATPTFNGLVELANSYGVTFGNSQSQEANDAARAAADSFLVSCTGATDKTKKGGTGSGYLSTILLGERAAKMQHAIQSRLEYWQELYDNAGKPDKDGKAPNAKEVAATQALAMRYIVVCGDAPEYDGSWPEDKKTGKPKTPKHNGRPGGTINGVTIKPGRGTDRKAQFAQFATLYDTYGEGVLLPETVDMFLDNGGKYEVPEDNSPQRKAALAKKAVEDLLVHGANVSADSAYLALVVAVLDRIATHGLKANTVAGGQIAQPDETQTQDATQDDSSLERESATIPPAPIQDGGSVAFGAAPVAANDATQSNQSRRRRRGK